MFIKNSLRKNEIKLISKFNMMASKGFLANKSSKLNNHKALPFNHL